MLYQCLALINETLAACNSQNFCTIVSLIQKVALKISKVRRWLFSKLYILSPTHLWSWYLWNSLVNVLSNCTTLINLTLKCAKFSSRGSCPGPLVWGPPIIFWQKSCEIGLMLAFSSKNRCAANMNADSLSCLELLCIRISIKARFRRT